MDKTELLAIHARYDRHIGMIKQCLALASEIEALLLDICRREIEVALAGPKHAH